MAKAAMAGVKKVTPAEVELRMRRKEDVLIVDARDADEIRVTGMIPGSINVSLGMLAIRADRELPKAFRDPRLQDRNRSIVTTCSYGPNGARAAKELKDMGFIDVHYLEGGVKRMPPGSAGDQHPMRLSVAFRDCFG
ncbi:MAG TPA: rhodanese-like domain-containing protein [Syntrophales bacterium]|nr:rhodanese-like domain-containing protein [Syntrophales bacterium]